MKRQLNLYLDIWDTRLNWKTQIIWPIFYSLLIVGTMILMYRENSPVQLIGITVTGLSFIVMIISRFQLKNAFSTKARKPNKIVTNGLFSKVRHPIYLSTCFALGGIALYLQNAIAWEYKNYIIVPFFLLFVYIQKSRAKKEEKLLYLEFKENYMKYCTNTWF